MTPRSRPPSSSIYDQTLPAGGYGYFETRDGTKLALTVHLPGPAEDGPYPTLVEYSGYGTADPDGPESGIQPVAELLGYAVVDVSMRGTGCSAGAFDFFERLQALDGYDAIETVARQPWVAHGKVGMLGISYGGISQLFVGATRPPSLAAITPLSVIDDTVTTLYPGGVLNTGFAFEWAVDRVEDSAPAGPTTGQPWAWEQIQAGDTVCAENQDLHPEAVDLIAKIRRNRYYRPQVADPLAPRTFVDKIDVPVYMACQWTDEQTGGHCPSLVGAFGNRERKWFTFTNGAHIDSLDPVTFLRWFDFLELYVAQRKPQLTPAQRGLAPVLYSAFMGVPGIQLPDDPIQQQPDYASALSAFEALPPVRVLFDNGAGSANPGEPFAAFERSFENFPVPGTKAKSLYLTGDGALAGRSGGSGADRFTWNPGVRPPTDFTGNTGSGTNGLWTATPPYGWTQNPAGTALSYVSAPLGSDTAVLGAGRGRALGALVGQERRPAGDRLGGAPGRQRELRPGRLAADRGADPRRGAQHPARAGAELPQARCRHPAEGQVGEGDGAALLPGPHLSPGIEHPGDDLGARRRSAGLGVRRGSAAGLDPVGRGRPLEEAAIAAGASGGSGGDGADRGCRPARACAASPVASTCRSRTPPSASPLPAGR